MEYQGVVWSLGFYKSIASPCGKRFLSLVSGGSAGSSPGEWMMPRSTRVAKALGLCEIFLQIEKSHICKAQIFGPRPGLVGILGQAISQEMDKGALLGLA